LGVSESWFYKWHGRAPTPRQRRGVALVAAITASFVASGGTYGSPRVLVDLRAAGWKVTKHTVARLMAAEGLVARAKKRRRNLTRPDKRAVPFPDLVRRDFSAPAPNVRWCGDVKHIDTGEGPLYLASVEDLFSRRMLGFAMSEHPDARLCRDALHMAATVRGGDVAGAIFHSDKGSTYTADLFTSACVKLKIRQSMGRVGSALDNAAAESFFSTLEHELLTRNAYATRTEARRAVARWIDAFYNPRRRHSTCAMLSPIDYEHAATAVHAAA
jgi:putative transposase